MRQALAEINVVIFQQRSLAILHFGDRSVVADDALIVGGLGLSEADLRTEQEIDGRLLRAGTVLSLVGLQATLGRTAAIEVGLSGLEGRIQLPKGVG